MQSQKDVHEGPTVRSGRSSTNTSCGTSPICSPFNGRNDVVHRPSGKDGYQRAYGFLAVESSEGFHTPLSLNNSFTETNEELRVKHGFDSALSEPSAFAVGAAIKDYRSPFDYMYHQNFPEGRSTGINYAQEPIVKHNEVSHSSIPSLVQSTTKATMHLTVPYGPRYQSRLLQEWNGGGNASKPGGYSNSFGGGDPSGSEEQNRKGSLSSRSSSWSSGSSESLDDDALMDIINSASTSVFDRPLQLTDFLEKVYPIWEEMGLTHPVKKSKNEKKYAPSRK